MAYQPTDWEHGDIITGGKLNKIEQELTHVADTTTYGFGGAQLSSDGLTPLSYINAGDPMPANPKKGDTVFLKDGNDFLIYSYNGEEWVLKVDPDLSNRIEETIKTASDNTDKAITDNNNQINETINQVAKEQADLAVKDGDFVNKAQAMADKALSDAQTNTATVAKSTLDTANQNIADAKKSIADDITQEATDRATAVTAVDAKAQGYADAAKKNAIDVATSADGVINKKIDDTASGITSTVSQNKKDADGKIITAQSTATQALTGLNSKVDTSTYNAKTGQLSTDVTNVTQTANQAKTDIASIKQTDTSQDARMNTIESDATGTKQTVSSLQTTQGVQSGSIATLQTRANGFEATVTKVNNLSIGTRNYFLNSSGSSMDKWFQSDGWAVLDGTNRGTVFSITPTTSWTGGNHNALLQMGISIPSGTQVTVSFWAKSSINNSKFHSEPSGSYTSYNPTLTTDWAKYSYTFNLTSSIIYFMGVDAGTTYYLDDIKLEIGNIATDWTAAPEDFSSATAKAQLTADNAVLSLSTYKTDADGRITKAQSDIVSTIAQVATKVSQTDYNAKTGDLTTKVTTAQQTADSVTSDVASYKQTTNNSIIAQNTKISQNTSDILLRATNTDLNAAKNDYNAQIAQVKINAESVTSQVSNNTGSITAQQLTIDGLTDTVSKQGINIDSVTQRVTTAEGTLTTTTNNISGLQTKQTTTANQVTQEIADRKTGDNNTLQSSKDFTTSSITGYDTGLQTQLTQTNSGILATVSANNLIVDSSLMDSAVSNSIVNWDQSGANRFYYSSDVAYQGVQSIGYNETSRGTDFSWLHSQTWISYSFAGSTLNVSVDIKANKMGGTATDGLVISLVECDAKMAVIAKTTIASITTANTNWVNYRKNITVNSASKNFYLSYAMQGNGNVYIARPYVGVQALVTGGYTAGANNNNQTILSLFKDNWSIGINDNIGGIVSGIVGNASQISLISKNVTIDSPNTQIKGTAWINSAMIANSAIGSAQIGDATITSAKIAQLDVAKLTGDTTSFIKSNWNSAYSNVSISPSDILLSSYSGTTLMTELDIGSQGINITLPGVSSFLDSTLINANGISFRRSSGRYASIGVIDSGFSLSNNTLGGNPMSIMIGDGDKNPAENLAFSISSNQSTGVSPQLIWAGSNTGDITTKYTKWSNPRGWIVADNITFSTWDDSASIVTVDQSVNYYNYAPTQVYGQYFSEGLRSLHLQGATLANGNKWFGFFDGNSKAGFGTDNTQDVLVYVKGKSYSLYTMLSKLGML